MRIVNDHDFRLRIDALTCGRNVREQFFRVGNIEHQRIGRSEHYGMEMRRKIRGGHDGSVPCSEQCQTHVRESFLRANANDGFGFGIKPNAIVLQISGGNFSPQLRNASCMAISVQFRIFNDFDQLVGNERVRRVTGAAHSEVDDIGTGSPFFVFEFIQFRKKIGWQPFDPFGHIDRKGRSIFLRLIVCRILIVKVVGRC
jgi:hypothetical protein